MAERSTDAVHRADQFRSSVPGVEAFALVSNRSFPRHAHDQFGIGVIAAGAHRSWSGIGPVEAEAGDVITVNPGEMHDGSPLDGRTRCWHMLYLDPALVRRFLSDEVAGTVEIARPVLRDAVLARRFARLFVRVASRWQDVLSAEQEVAGTVMHLFRHHGAGRAAVPGPVPCVARALRLLTEAPEQPVSLSELSELSGVSRFQLLRGFARAVGTTPHAFLMQQRVRLARRLLRAGRSPAEAAAEAGFADQSHLTRAFVRQLAITPARYRAATA